MSKINFFFETNPVKITKSILKKWITTVIESYNFKIKSINFIFCDDPFLLDINKRFLSHDYYTDIITFDNSEIKGFIESDIYISIERVEENAKKANSAFSFELHRVIIHGILHLLGFKDKSKKDKLLMRAKEEELIELLNVPRGTNFISSTWNK